MQPDTSVPPPPIGKKNNVVLWIVLGVAGACVLCVAVGGAILFPVFAQAKLNAKMSATMSDLRKVGPAMMTYVSDYDDKFPPKTASLSEAWPFIQGYAKSAMPESHNEGHPEFLGNEKLAGVAATSIVTPSKTFMFFDSAPWAGQKRVMLTVDGDVNKISEAEFQDGILNGMVGK